MCNVLLDPLEGSNLVHQTIVGHLWVLVGGSVGVEEAKDAQPVVDGDDHHIAITGQYSAIIQVTRTPAVRLTMNKQHHR